MNVFIRAIVRIFSWGERLIVPIGTINLSPNENTLTIALIYIHYLYTRRRISLKCQQSYLTRI